MRSRAALFAAAFLAFAAWPAAAEVRPGTFRSDSLGREVPRVLAFGHGAVHDLGGGLRLFCSFHVSQQNTFTGRLTPRSFDAVLGKVKRHLARG